MDKLTKKQIKELSNIINKYHKTLRFVVPYYKDIKLDFVNSERTSKNRIPMYEIKTTKYQNVSSKELIDELNQQQNLVIKKVEKCLELKFNLKIKLEEHPNGSGHLLFFENFKIKDNCLENYPKFTNLKLSSDYTGSYHFWITLPNKQMNQKSMYILQSLEPLLCSLFCAPDPNITIDNKTRFKSGYRSAINYFASFGTASIYDYSSQKLKKREVKYNEVKPRKLGIETYIELINQKIKERIDDEEYPDYLLFVNIDDKIGTDFRRKKGIDGYEFRILDHFPQKHLETITQIIYLIVYYSEYLKKDEMEFSLENQGWNNQMKNALFEGSQMKIDRKYLEFISRQLKINKKILNKNSSQELLKSILNYFQKVILDIKNNLFLEICQKRFDANSIYSFKTLL